MTLSRRDTLLWVMAAAALPDAVWAQAGQAPGGVVDWPSAGPAPPPAKGYGDDPNLMKPSVPWPLTLSRAQRATIDVLGDMILPADDKSPGAGKLGVGAFIDEWISAPYPTQRADRTRVLSGLAWLDAQSRATHGAAFGAITTTQRAAMLDALTIAQPSSGMAEPVAFMDRLCYLFVLGFYSLPEGKADMGFVGDLPTPGDYPGPTPEALAHFNRMIAGLGLKA